MLKKIELPYQSGFEYYQRIYHCLAPVLLDSTTRARFDIVTAEPTHLIEQKGAVAYKIDVKSQKSLRLDKPAIEFIEENQVDIKQADLEDLPFVGGWLGVLSYDFARNLKSIPETIPNDTNLPDLWFGYYEWTIVSDHETNKTYLVYNPEFEGCAQFKKFLSALDSSPEDINPQFEITSDFNSSFSKEGYCEQFKKIEDYIYQGHIYQTNFSQRFNAKFEGDPIHAYRILREKNPAPYAAMMKLNDKQWLCSCSPERFIKVQDSQVNTMPIKGTRPRFEDPKLDEASKNELIHSKKDQAENLMIVDLLRNDLSQNCVPGTVKVPELFACHSFKNVHHLISTVTGTLAENNSYLKLILDAFPGGSVTGTPKLRAMEISEEIEPVRRSFFCGSVMYLSKHQRLDSNIIIRTLALDNDTLYLWAGGGIVYDSTAEDEYQETFHKVNNIIHILKEFNSCQI